MNTSFYLSAFARQKMPLWVGLLSIVCILFSSSPLEARTKRASRRVTASAKTINTIATDMTLPHESKLLGVPDTKDWAFGPRVNMGNDPGDFKAMTAWGQLYEDAAGNPATNTRVQIRAMRSYLFKKRTRRWIRIQNSYLVDGAAFRTDYADNVSKPADIRKEEDGSLSVSLSPGYNYHFWTTTGRVDINPDDIGGIITSVNARLIVDDPSKPDDRRKARYLMSMGGDYWLDRKAQWDYFKTNGDIGIGRFKYVGRRWKSFYMTSMSEEELRRNPPPMR